MTRAVLSAVLLLLSACGGKPASVWDKYAEQEGVTVLESENEHGQDTRIITLPNGVSVNQVYTENGVETSERDNSQAGPVLCAWEAYLTMRSELEACYPDRFTTVKAELDGALARFNGFIVENSAKPYTAEEVTAIAGKKMAYQGECAAPLFDWNSLNAVQETKFIRSLHRDVDKVLATPRPPVMEPCR